MKSNHKGSRRMRRLLAATAVAALGLSGCADGGGASGDDDSSAPSALTFGNARAPVSINPALSGRGAHGTFLQPAYEPLVRTSPEGDLLPALAAEWELSEDNTTATFTLRDDASFSDGEPVNAEAAKDSIEYFVEANGPFSNNFDTLESIDVIDEFTFSVTMSTPNPDLLSLFDAYNLAGLIISPAAIENPEVLGSASHGAGPYVLDTARTVTDTSYVYVPNEHYYGDTHWSEVTINVYEDQNSAIQAMRTGQVDVLMSDAMTANANAAGLPEDISIVDSPSQWVGVFLYDRTGEVVEALGDVRVRQALNYAIDRGSVASGLLGDYAEPTVQIRTEGVVGYDPSLEEEYPYDPELARQLLAEAGYPDGFTLPITYTVSSLYTTLSQVVASQLAEVGITVEYREAQNGAEQEDILIAGDAAGDFMAFNSQPAYLSSLQLFDEDARFNYFGYIDPAMEELLDAARTASVDDAPAAWEAVYRYPVEEAWFLPLYAGGIPYFVSDGVHLEAPGAAVVADIALLTPAES